MIPKIKFKINLAKDVSSFFNFLEEIKYDDGRNFEWAVFKCHPSFNRFKTDTGINVTKKDVKSYVDTYYLKNKEQIEKNFVIFENNWRVKENAFFKLTEKIFSGINWPKGRYIAYSTIWGMYPKFLDDKTFQIPALTNNKKSVSLIIAHELLHFIFFTYFLNKYKKYQTHKYDFFVWHVSEIFNSIILRQPEWRKLLEADNQDYPEHKKIITKLSKQKYPLVGLVEKIILEVEKIVD